MRRLFRRGRSGQRGRTQLSSRLSEAILVLEKRRRILLGMLGKLEERREHLRSRIVSTRSKNDRDKLAMYVSEYKDVEKLIKLLKTAELSLQRAELRLDSVKYYVAINGEVSAAIGAVKSVGDVLREMPGSLSKIADELVDTLSWLNGELTLTSDGRIDVAAVMEGKIDVQNIIDEAVNEVAGSVLDLSGTSEPYEEDELREEANNILAAAKSLASDRGLLEAVATASKKDKRNRTTDDDLLREGLTS